MLEFDLNRTDFTTLIQNNQKPAIVQLMAKIKNKCDPLQLYATLQNTAYSYLLESVEKEKKHARYSFVGSEPEVIVAIKDKILTIECQLNSNLSMFVYNKLKTIGKVEVMLNGKFKVEIPEEYDCFDAFRIIFPTNSGVKLLNETKFGRQTFLCGAIGYNSYDLVYNSWIKKEKKSDAIAKDMHFAMMTKTFVFDHIANETYLILTPFINENCDPSTIYDNALLDAHLMEHALYMSSSISLNSDISSKIHYENITKTDQTSFEKSVIASKQHIINGDIFQVVISRKRTIKTNQTPLQLYIRLRKINPSPYMYIFKFKDIGIVGASPETLMTIYNNNIIVNPIAGTCPRGHNDKEDEKFAQQMLHDEKERAEHVMLVDLGRNDVRMVSKSGSVYVDDMMNIVKYSHMQHIESTISGKIRDECDQFDATRAIFPAGTLSGAPKIRAMEIIDDLESCSRGIYGGGVGYYSWNGDSDFAIVIRTVLIKNNVAVIQAGAGIVAESDPTYEYNETERKMAAMIKAIGASL